MPVQWTGLQALKITDAGDGHKFVVLAQTAPDQLTGWHRLYSLLYRFGWRRGFLITSAMQDSEELLREIMEELSRMAQLGTAAPIAIDDRKASPLFRLLLGRRQQPAPVVVDATSQALDRENAIHADYHPWINSGLLGVTVLLGGLALWHYLRSWITFIYYVFPSSRSIAFFQDFAQADVKWAWGLLIGAHIGIAAIAAIIGLMFHLFPTITAESQGLILTVFGRSQRIGWQQVQVVKSTSLNDEEERHIVLIETTTTALPWWYRIGSWVYDGGIGRGGLVWPFAQNFEALMQRVALELTRQPAAPDAPPRLRDDATGWLILLVTQPAAALDQLVEAAHQTEIDQRLDRQRLMDQLPKMAWIAVLPALILLASSMLLKGDFNPRNIGLVVISLLWGLAEWPLVSMLARAVDDMVGSGTKGFEGLYLYPTSQLPRLLPLVGALVLVLLGFPALGFIVWFGAIIWSAILTAGLWEALYNWHGGALIGGSVLGVLMQLFTLIAVAASS